MLVSVCTCDRSSGPGGRGMCWILSLHMSAPGGLFSKEGTDGAVGVCLREFQELGRANMLDRHALQFLLQGEPARPSLLPERQEAPAPGRPGPDHKHLPSEAAAELKQHWQACSECREQGGSPAWQGALHVCQSLRFDSPLKVTSVWRLSKQWVLISETQNSSLGRYHQCPHCLQICDPHCMYLRP